MSLQLSTPDQDGLAAAVAALRSWQHDVAPMQLHPGDLGWYERYGSQRAAAAVRTWSQDGQLLALAFLDEADLARLTTAPEVSADEAVAAAIAADLDDPARGVLPAGRAYVEAPDTYAVKPALEARGWLVDEAWTPLRRDLAEPVDDPGLRVEEVGPERAADWAGVLSSAFGNPAFDERRWQAIVAGVCAEDATSLVGYDTHGTAVAAITVWSAGPGRPGLIEPMGVHAEHRGHGYGRGITLAGAATLRERGASSVLVCTPSTLVGAVATYRSAGLVPGPERTDRRRDG
ncbi:GNAT family N-acetyltransferase [Ruania albidiflava]|uniref:GNAT family N-acetyltransferase n=1 Tax=Ruania albidiflava TaxID=366586 RepID=UPI0003B500F4|nr:GNAT family N-acetyltransferase [Ruania albidiflava]